MSANQLLSRLDKVRQTGQGRWVACCPAHEDRSPSLSIRQLDDDRTLLHCFAGCAVEEVLSATGLTFDALFQEKPIGDVKRERRPFNAHDVLACLASEALIVALVASDIAKGNAVTETDKDRVMLAATRIETARRIANGT